MFEVFAEFFRFTDPNVRFVTAGTVLLGITAGISGNFTVLRRRALIGDAVAHAVLPGVVGGYVLAGGRNLFFLTVGALLSGWLALWLIDSIRRHSRVGSDTALGVVLSGFFGLGMMGLTALQGSGRGDLSGLNALLFGQAASLVPTDVLQFSILCVIVLGTVAVFYRELLMQAFDEPFAAGAGVPVKRLNLLMNTLLVIVIVAGLQTVGVVLMASMLILPAVAARQWTDDLRRMLVISAGIGALSGIGGSLASFTSGNIPTGPMMVLSAAFLLGLSVVFAPNRGIAVRIFRQMAARWKARSENVLKAIYKLEEHAEVEARAFSAREIAQRASAGAGTGFHLSYLRLRGRVERFAGDPDGFSLTVAGRTEARRLVRLHRLWELYLTERMRLAPDHVHDQAETLEHILTPELESRLIDVLNRPVADPHQAPIPYEEGRI